MKELTLYHKQTCPFCIKVLHYMEQEGIDIPLKNVADYNNYEELVGIGGKGQVPALSIGGNILYESDDIIQWFKDNKSTNNITKDEWMDAVHYSDTCDLGRR